MPFSNNSAASTEHTEYFFCGVDVQEHGGGAVQQQHSSGMQAGSRFVLA
jgi:hypothetical protein